MTTTDSRPEAAGRPEGDQSTLLGRYLLQDVIGRGGMATVYRALDTMLERPVAVKLLLPHLCQEPEFVERFLAMERRIARLFHPHLVTLFDAAASNEGCFVVMEYLSGGSLRDRLSAGSAPPPVGEAIRILAQVADAIQVLHEQGIVHGDVKPDNILLDEHGDAKLVDFGIAHLATTTGIIKRDELSGTTAYLAPEQLRDGRTDARSDIYALGLVAYELLAGRRAFEGDNWLAVATQRLERDPDPLQRVRPELPGPLVRVITRALARDPAKRFESAAAFREALEQCEATANASPPPAERATATPADLEATVPVAATTVPLLPQAPPRRRLGLGGALGRGGEVGARVARALSPVVERVRAGGAGLRPGILQVPERLTAWRDAAAARLAAVRRRHPAVLPALGGLLAVVLLLLALSLPRLLNPPRPVAVPALAGQPVEMARTAARQVGLALAVSEEPSESAPRGMVLRQEPAPDSIIPSDQAVRLVVSSGPPPVKVPDVAGRRLEDARRDLSTAGLSLGDVQERETSRQPWGTVIEQSARPGSQAERGSAVDVTVAVPPWTTAPNLSDKAIGDAEAELQKRGLRLGAVRLQPVAGQRAGTVIAQEPAPAVKIRQGQAVAVTIAVPPTQASASDR